MTASPPDTDPRVMAMVHEFAAAQGFEGTPEVTHLYTSIPFPQTRLVYKVTLDGQAFALKLDYEAGPDDRLSKEFKQLQDMRSHFAKFDKVDLVTPVYLSPKGKFCVTEFLDLRTAGERLQAVENEQTRKQVFRRAGMFLHVLHTYRPLKTNAYWGNWMPIEIDEIAARGTMQADPADVASFREVLKKQIRNVNKIVDSHAWSHGDFHAENLMLGPGVTYGLDFTEARRKMAVYDIVDFLKVDIHRKTQRSDLDQAGITTAHREMFFKGYKHPINQEVLDVSLRGRLLIDWMSITRNDYHNDENVRTTFDKFKNRIDVAFGRA